jgi:hypothetical protein
MKTTLDTSAIARALKSDQNAAWSWNGAKALAEYLEQREEETGEEMELNVCAIRCDFPEFRSLMDFSLAYFGRPERVETEIGIFDSTEETDDAIREFIADRGTLIEFDGGVIVSSF